MGGPFSASLALSDSESLSDPGLDCLEAWLFVSDLESSSSYLSLLLGRSTKLTPVCSDIFGIVPVVIFGLRTTLKMYGMVCSLCMINNLMIYNI